MNRGLTMPQRVEAYLSARRALGYELRVEGEQLRRFARFAEQHGHRGALTLELALDWANAIVRSSSAWIVIGVDSSPRFSALSVARQLNV